MLSCFVVVRSAWLFPAGSSGLQFQASRCHASEDSMNADDPNLLMLVSGML